MIFVALSICGSIYVCSAHVREFWLVEKSRLFESALCWKLEWDAPSAHNGSNAHTKMLFQLSFFFIFLQQASLLNYDTKVKLLRIYIQCCFSFTYASFGDAGEVRTACMHWFLRFTWLNDCGDSISGIRWKCLVVWPISCSTYCNFLLSHDSFYVCPEPKNGM